MWVLKTMEAHFTVIHHDVLVFPYRFCLDFPSSVANAQNMQYSTQSFLSTVHEYCIYNLQSFPTILNYQVTPTVRFVLQKERCPKSLFQRQKSLSVKFYRTFVYKTSCNIVWTATAKFYKQIYTLP